MKNGVIENSGLQQKKHTFFSVYSYPFGMQMPNRINTNLLTLTGTTEQYRFNYNGMEVDNEVSGNGNSYTTEFRQYDPRLGRWKSLDPLMKQFPQMSPYCAFDNNPIYYTDPYGLSALGGGKEKRMAKKEAIQAASDAYIDSDNVIGGKITSEYDKKTDTVTLSYRRDNGDGSNERVKFRVQGVVNGAGGAVAKKKERDPTTWETNTGVDMNSWPVDKMVPGDLIYQYLNDPYGVNTSNGIFGDYRTYKYLGNSNFIMTDDFDQLDGYKVLAEGASWVIPVGRAFKLVGTGIKWVKAARAAKKAANALQVTFGKTANQISHAFRHTDAMGLSREVVQNAVKNHLPGVADDIAVGTTKNFTVSAGGKDIIYSAYKNAAGSINVGRITGTGPK